MTESQCISYKDEEIHQIIQKERQRQKENLELIASENFTSCAVLQANSSILTNKYSEGYPSQRFYGGNEFIDQMETICINRALKAFKLGNDWGVNVQSLSGSPANFAVYTALIGPGGKIMGMDLPSGGHLTHGYQTKNKKVSATSLYFESKPYKLINDKIDYQNIEELAREFKPNIIVCGASSFPRDFDYSEFRRIADINNSYLMADIAHISGFVITGLMNNPFEYCDVVTTTTHKTLRGPRGALIFYRKEKNGINIAEKINSAVFPMLQGGPHNQTIAAIAVSLKESMTNTYKKYIHDVRLNAQTLAYSFISKGYTIFTGGTDCHMVVIDLTEKNLPGSVAERICEAIYISVNKNALPSSKSVLNPFGLRFGTSALTTRNFACDDFEIVAEFVDSALKIGQRIFEELGNDLLKLEISELIQKYPELLTLQTEVKNFASKFPIPYFDYLLKH